MICNICKIQKGPGVFSSYYHQGVVVDLEYLTGICFDCYCLVPEHIPRKQARQFLERTTNDL
jgi:hypothetical protein